MAGEGWGWVEKAPPCDDFKVTYDCINSRILEAGRSVCDVMSEAGNIMMSYIFFSKWTCWIDGAWWRVINFGCGHQAGQAGALLQILQLFMISRLRLRQWHWTGARRLVLTISRVKSRVLALTQLSHLICCSLNDVVQVQCKTWGRQRCTQVEVISASSCFEEVICPVIMYWFKEWKPTPGPSAVFLLISISSTETPTGNRRELFPSQNWDHYHESTNVRVNTHHPPPHASSLSLSEQV